MPSSNSFKDALRVVFDSQIPNYGDYNLVYASHNAPPSGEHQDSAAAGPAQYYVVGYRWQPTEIVVAPFNGRTLTAGGDPTEINMTNLSHAVALPAGEYEVGTSTGKTFQFGVEPVGRIPAATPPAEKANTVDQRDDHEDFLAFMRAFVEMS